VPVTCADLYISLHNFQALLRSELGRQLFLEVDAQDAHFFEQEHLFGEGVYDAFKSARDDIKEAGNCLACGRATATVFHLMRAAEIGLALLLLTEECNLLSVPTSRSTYANGKKFISRLENKVAEIQNYKLSHAREKQLTFYHGAMVELRAFKSIRNPTMHARETYDIHQARSAMTHISVFMRILAEKISESKRTPKKWRKAQL
jgi:hypothetical protein